METEQRVQALEKELEILKTEIQAILLDIQEQVLSNTYLDLRSSETAHAQENAPRPQPKAEEPPQSNSSFRKVSFDDHAPLDDDDDDDFMPPIPVVKAKSAKPTSDARVMAEMKEWATQKIETLGMQKTSELIHMYAAQGRFTPEVHDALLKFIALQSDRQQEAPTQPSRPAGFAAQLPQNRQPGSAAARPMQPSIPGAIYVPASKPAKNNGTSAPAPAPVAHAPAPKTKASAAKPQPAPTAQAAPQKEATASPTQQNVVLRLIAGVQNAGAGVRWGKK